MNPDDQQARWENLFQLSLTGELTEAQQDELELAFDDGFVPTTLPRSAPRDFAAEAIAQVIPVVAPRDFVSAAIQSARPTPSRSRQRYIAWGMAAAAAVALLLAITHLIQPSPASPMRLTVAISAQLDSIEHELSTPRVRTRFRPHS